MKSIWWVKRDMRLYDNEALHRAIVNSKEVLPVFIFEPLVLHGPDASVSHAEAMRQSIISLQKNIQHHGSELALYHDELISSFNDLRKRYRFLAIYSYQEIGLNHTYTRDKELARWCRENNITWIEVPYPGVVRGPLDRDTYHIHIEKYLREKIIPVPKLSKYKPKIALTKKMKFVPSLHDLGFKTAPQHIWPVSEKRAFETINDFLNERGYGYSGGISSMNTAPQVCSRISIHLAWERFLCVQFFAKSISGIKN